MATTHHGVRFTSFSSTPPNTHQKILAEPSPFVLQTALDDFYVRYEVNDYTNDAHAMQATYSLLHQNIQETFNGAGVEIMSPHYRAERDGNATTIPVPPHAG